MREDENKLDWCRSCGVATEPDETSHPDEPLCPRCGRRLVRYEDLSRVERASYRFDEWQEKIHSSGLWGPSPGGAAAELGCHRSMIDKLSDLGVLEKSIYDKDGYFVVFISMRSLVKAKANKQKTGKWTDAGKE